MRRWGPVLGPVLLYVMLNPSTATEVQNDPTIERCERRARALGFSGLGVVNLFAFRATRPADLKRAADPIGPLNDAAIRTAARRADQILCAWGVHGQHLCRDARVRAILRGQDRPMLHLGLTNAGAPRHPLYVPYARPLQPWDD
ncbi:DUF1643 domain-containing protein [Paracoccus sp. M683]|nr:DUF1643 domain-containing protein [Paracoccus sp. M683]